MKGIAIRGRVAHIVPVGATFRGGCWEHRYSADRPRLTTRQHDVPIDPADYRELVTARAPTFFVEDRTSRPGAPGARSRGAV